MPQGMMYQAAGPPTQPPHLSFAVRQPLAVPQAPQSIDTASQDVYDFPVRTTRAHTKTSGKAAKRGGKGVRAAFAHTKRCLVSVFMISNVSESKYDGLGMK